MYKRIITSIALLGATRITLTKLPLNKPFHPSVFMILLNTSPVEFPLLPTIKWVLMVSKGATVVRDTAPAKAPLINLLREGFFTLILNPLKTPFFFPLTPATPSSSPGTPVIFTFPSDWTYLTYNSVQGILMFMPPSCWEPPEEEGFGSWTPNPIPIWLTLANIATGSWTQAPHWDPKLEIEKRPFLSSSKSLIPLPPINQNLSKILFFWVFCEDGG